MAFEITKDLASWVLDQAAGLGARQALAPLVHGAGLSFRAQEKVSQELDFPDLGWEPFLCGGMEGNSNSGRWPPPNHTSTPSEQ